MQVPYNFSCLKDFFSVSWFLRGTHITGRKRAENKRIIAVKSASSGVLQCLAFPGRDGCSDF
jgi:hypothetical protein